MRIVPAVDVRGGRCVRLVQGDYQRETVFADDPLEQAQRWWDILGRGMIHIVDLDGAKSGRCTIGPLLRSLSDSGIAFEVGGGIRDAAALEAIFEAGASRVILGTAAHRDPQFLAESCKRWPGQIAVGIDARDGKVALSGWLEDSATDAIAFAKRVEAAGAARIIYTDIARDGMLAGPNFEATAALAHAVGIPVTLSGGISSIADIRAAHVLESDGVDEVIVGKALYVGAFTLEEAVATAEEIA